VPRKKSARNHSPFKSSSIIYLPTYEPYNGTFGSVKGLDGIRRLSFEPFRKSISENGSTLQFNIRIKLSKISGNIYTFQTRRILIRINQVRSISCVRKVPVTSLKICRWSTFKIPLNGFILQPQSPGTTKANSSFTTMKTTTLYALENLAKQSINLIRNTNKESLNGRHRYQVHPRATQ
jgi:hypothetical protein